jgi:hypothetical protein
MSYEKIKAVAAQILNRIPAVRGKGEQATKQSLVLPMLDALGYDIWDPAEVCPEYDADFAIKKAGQKEKVDVAIILASAPRIFIETKPLDEPLDGHSGQVARYFNATPTVTLGVLTNGVEWRFYTDTGDPNIMDDQPFHIARLDAPDQGLDVVARFAKSVFSPEAIRDYATELRYTAQIASFLRLELDLKDREPSEYFIRWALKSEGMYHGVVNANVVERFRPITKDALTRVVREIVRRSISAMEQEAAQPVASATTLQPRSTDPDPTSIASSTAPNSAVGDLIESHRTQIETTERELRAFEIVKGQFDRSPLLSARIYDATARREVPLEIAYKDTTGYFGIYFNKPAWWIIRVSIEGRKNWVGFNVDQRKATGLVPTGMVQLEPSPYADVRVQISAPDDLLRLEALISAAFEKAISDRNKQ